MDIRPYSERAMRLLVNHVAALAEQFLGLIEDGDRFGKRALAVLYERAVVGDPIHTAKYNDLADDAPTQPAHTRRDTPVTRTIGQAISLYGWRGLIEGLELFAKNKEAQLVESGMPGAAEVWKRVQNLVRNFPKNPQQ